MKIAVYILLLIPGSALPQMLAEGSMIKIKPDDVEEVVLYSARDCDHCYYYLPSALKISKKEGHAIPEASLVTWKNDESSKTVGGIFHFLVAWGLTAAQEKNVRELVRSDYDSLGVVLGPALVDPHGDGMAIEGSDKLFSVLKATLKNTPSIPTTPGAKVAFSFRFTENEIGDFLYYVNHPEKTKTNLKATYTYAVINDSGQERINKITLRLPFKQILTNIKENK